MKTRLFIIFAAALTLAACSAFDNSNKPYDGFGPDIVPPPGIGGGAYEGKYVGELTLTENTCENLAEEVDSAKALEVNVLQSGDLVSLGFDDESEASGTLDGANAIVIKRDVSDTMIFHIEFSETGMTGDVSYIDGAPIGDQLGEPCAKYSVSLTKE